MGDNDNSVDQQRLFEGENIEDTLTKYATDANCEVRQEFTKVFLHLLRQRPIEETLHNIHVYIAVLLVNSEDTVPSVRISLVEQIPYIYIFCNEHNCPDLGRNLFDHLLQIILRYLHDEDIEVRREAYATLINMLLGKVLIDKKRIEDEICPKLLPILENDIPDDQSEFVIKALVVMEKVSLIIGYEKTKEYFLDKFIVMCSSNVVNIKKTCASIFPIMCYVLGTEITENQLLDVFDALCEDSFWGVRKACAESISLIALICSRECRKEKLTPIVLKLARDESKWVCKAVYRILGEFISSFAQPCVIGLALTCHRELRIINPMDPDFMQLASPELLDNYNYYLRMFTKETNSTLLAESQQQYSDSTDNSINTVSTTNTDPNNTSVELNTATTPTTMIVTSSSFSNSKNNSNSSDDNISDDLMKTNENNNNNNFTEHDYCKNNKSKIHEIKSTDTNLTPKEVAKLINNKRETIKEKSFRTDPLHVVISKNRRSYSGIHSMSFTFSALDDKSSFDSTSQELITPSASTSEATTSAAAATTTSTTATTTTDTLTTASVPSNNTETSKITKLLDSSVNRLTQLTSNTQQPFNRRLKEMAKMKHLSDLPMIIQKITVPNAWIGNSTSSITTPTITPNLKEVNLQSDKIVSNHLVSENDNRQTLQQSPNKINLENKNDEENKKNDQNDDKSGQIEIDKENMISQNNNFSNNDISNVGGNDDKNQKTHTNENHEKQLKRKLSDKCDKEENEKDEDTSEKENYNQKTTVPFRTNCTLEFNTSANISNTTEHNNTAFSGLNSMIQEIHSIVGQKNQQQKRKSSKNITNFTENKNHNADDDAFKDYNSFIYWYDEPKDIDLPLIKENTVDHNVATEIFHNIADDYIEDEYTRILDGNYSSSYVTSNAQQYSYNYVQDSENYFDLSRRYSRRKQINLDFEQNIVPTELLRLYVAMDVADEFEDVNINYAYNFPAVALTIGKENWDIIREISYIFCEDMDWKVRKIVAISIGTLSDILGKAISTKDLVPIYLELLDDVDEVKIEALRNFAIFFKAVDETCHEEILTNVEKCLTHVNWHIKEELAKQICLLIEMHEIKKHDTLLFFNSFIRSFLEDKISCVREKAADALAAIVHCSNNIIREGVVKYLLVDEFALSDNWRKRQTFLNVLYKIMKYNKELINLIRLVIKHVLSLANDPIPNIRIFVAKCLVELVTIQPNIFECKTPEDNAIVETLKKLCLDTDRDVREISQKINFEEQFKNEIK